MVFSYYRESTEQPQESTLWDRFLWLTDRILLFHWATNFFTFLLWSVFLPCILKLVRHKQPQCVPSCTPAELNAILSLFLSLMSCSGGILPGISSASSEMLMIAIKALFAGPTLSPGNSGSQIIGMPPLKIRGSIWEGLQWGQQHDLLSLCSLWMLWLPALLVSDAGAFYPVSELHWHLYVSAHQQMSSTISFPV